jgi:hypothetical protein
MIEKIKERITQETHGILSKFMVLCQAAFVAILALCGWAFFFFSKTGFLYIALAVLKLVLELAGLELRDLLASNSEICLPLLPECWD